MFDFIREEGTATNLGRQQTFDVVPDFEHEYWHQNANMSKYIQKYQEHITCDY